jgi:hypothetical protein
MSFKPTDTFNAGESPLARCKASLAIRHRNWRFGLALSPIAARSLLEHGHGWPTRSHPAGRYRLAEAPLSELPIDCYPDGHSRGAGGVLSAGRLAGRLA